MEEDIFKIISEMIEFLKELDEDEEFEVNEI
ncbi:hypothetical protein EV215_1803 [Hypnocyclicus thermotrophus]|uniref:Uncharacterized protein n=1 Tax=Hypnocyclicus thermotrophus TaxID=1627895 RepID=A0AA46DXK3_9FUSO|nr:hypothetical protein EV215_1803 [Hypnocyclicus thermotrophus]